MAMAVCILGALTAQAQTYWNGTADKNLPGDGTEANPYLISTPEQLAGLAERTNTDKEDFAGKYLKLTADIYLTDFTNPDTETWKEWHPIAHEWWEKDKEPDYGYFRGHFDGDGHTVYNLYYGSGAGWGDDIDLDDPFFDWSEFLNELDYTAFNRALFANIDGGTIENLNISGARMEGVSNVAFLAIRTSKGSVIRNCHVQGKFIGIQCQPGALVCVNSGLIENCSANVDISGAAACSIVYENQTDGTIRSSTASGTITATAAQPGGFVWRNWGLIEQCVSSVDVTALYGKHANGQYAGHDAAGFVFENRGIIRECAATGNVAVDNTNTSTEDRGSAGFCQLNAGRIESSYCTGDIHDLSTESSKSMFLAQFVTNNGVYTGFSDASTDYGTILNCYSASHYVFEEANTWRSYASAFAYRYNNGVGLTISRQAGCWYNEDGMPKNYSSQSEAFYVGEGVAESYMKSQAFVDELNRSAKFFGTSQWELKDGLPRPTGVRTKEVTVFFGGGEGTEASPYLISNKEQLKNFRWLVNHGYDFMNEYIRQTADIELNAPEEQWEIEMPEEWEPIGYVHTHPYFEDETPDYFRGNYDGGFHEVRNMAIWSGKNFQGFFGLVGSTQYVNNEGGQQPVIIRNLGVTDAYMVVKGERGARTDGGSGILAAHVGEKVALIQCWTSGKLEAVDGAYADLGALFGTGGKYGHVLNCSSSARLTGVSNEYSGAKGFVKGGSNITWDMQDTLVNYLFAGNINDGKSGSYYRANYWENVFEDGQVANITYDYSAENNGVRTTAWLQSKECVNQLNAAVERWNATNDETLQLNYWQYNENAYPTVSPSATYNPGCSVTFATNGGSEVQAVKAVPGSTIQPPVRPTKENCIFAGWYKDGALTKLFDFEQDAVEQNMTLYARWLEDTRFDVDVTPFNNPFAKAFHIKTAAQLRGLAQLQNGVYEGNTEVTAPRDFTGKTIVLDNDIFLNDTTDWQQWGKSAYAVPWRSIGTESNSTQSKSGIQFKGTFDGQGHVIYGMYTEIGGTPGYEIGGLFYYVGEGAVIQNVGIEASVMNLKEQNPDGQINDERWYLTENDPDKNQYAGSQSMEYAAMLAGQIDNKVTVSQCYAVGRVYCKTNSNAGALVYGTEYRWDDKTVSNCYARVDIFQRGKDDPVGNFVVSSAECIEFTNCYSAGRTGDDSAYWLFNKELVTHYGGGPTGKTTAEMKRKATYEGWDFETVWGRNDDINDGYPFLRVFHPDATDSPDAQRGDVNGDGTVDAADVVAIVNYLVNKNSSSIDENAADMNGDGSINVADVMQVVNIVNGN